MQYSLAALDAFIATQRALLAQQLADIGRLHQLKASLDFNSQVPLPMASPAPPHHDSQNVLAHLKSTLAAAPTLTLSTHAGIKLQLPPALDWAAFARCDPTPVRALAVPPPPSVPGSFPGPPTPTSPQPQPQPHDALLQSRPRPQANYRPSSGTPRARYSSLACAATRAAPRRLLTLPLPPLTMRATP